MAASENSPSITCTASQGLLHLPTELLVSVSSYLLNSDIKSLRLACSALDAAVRLRIDRVFLSANSRNIEVLRAVADSDKYRTHVVEIIWDDARLIEGPTERHYHHSDYCSDDDEDEDEDGEGCPGWFSKACEANIDDLQGRKDMDADLPHHEANAKQVAAQLPISQSWSLYQELLQIQKDVIDSSADADALRYGLQRFPSLQRVTITPVAHGFLFCPLYNTPMIRALPYGFNYPIPRGWPTGEDEQRKELLPWVAGHGFTSHEAELEKMKWRGFCIVTNTLAQHIQNNNIPDFGIPEFGVDVHQLHTGINCHIFDQECEEYNDLVTILNQPGFRRLDLVLMVRDAEDDWQCFRSGLLRNALAKSPCLEHISLSTDVVEDPCANALEEGSGGPIEYLVPLLSVFPVASWPRLRHFGLSRFLVTKDDVFALLAALPLTLRSVELSFLSFLDGGGSYKELLEDMRNRLGWGQRAISKRPQVTICMDELYPYAGRGIWITKEVDDFLYADGPNPFEMNWQSHSIATGVGTLRDMFEPAYERPNEEFQELRRLGYYA